LPFCFDLLPECAFYFLPFLNVTRFKLGAFLGIKMETGLAKRPFALLLEYLTAQILSLAHEVALFWAHSHPNLGVAPEILAGFWRKCQPPLTYALARHRPLRPGPARGPPSGMM